MKLIFCPHCHDIKKLHVGTVTSCFCGKSSGKYLPDGVRVVLRGAAIPIGILNSSFVKAIKGRPETGLGSRFEAFVIPMECPTVGRES